MIGKRSRRARCADTEALIQDCRGSIALLELGRTVKPDLCGTIREHPDAKRICTRRESVDSGPIDNRVIGERNGREDTAPGKHAAAACALLVLPILKGDRGELSVILEHIGKRCRARDVHA